MNIKLKRVGYGLSALCLASNFVFLAPGAYASDGLFAKVASKGDELKTTLTELKLDIANEIATVKDKITSNDIKINLSINNNSILSGNSASASASASALNDNVVSGNNFSPSNNVTLAVAVNTTDDATAKAGTSTGTTAEATTGSAQVAKTVSTTTNQSSSPLKAPDTGHVTTEVVSAKASLLGAVTVSTLITTIVVFIKRH